MCGCNGKELEIDRYIGLPIFKHFTIIGFVKKKKKRFWFFFFTYIIIQSITSSEILFSAFDPSKCAHTWSSGHTHTHGAVDTHTHTHTPGAVDTHTHTHTEQWTHIHTHTEQWTHTHTHTHTPGAVDTHTHTHTHLEQWTLFTQEKLQHGHRM